jgi:hypothetical protein
MSSAGVQQPVALDEKHDKHDTGMHSTHVDEVGRVIDDVTGEEVEPVVTFKTWIVVLVCSAVTTV